MSDLVFYETELKMPLMRLPVRSTLVSLATGKVLLSPGSKLSVERLREMTGVTDIVGPSLFHCAGVPKAGAVHPAAKLWAAPGGRERKPKTNWSGELTKEVWPYQEELPFVVMDGMPEVAEAVFIHKKSRSLIVCDLCFNMRGIKGIGPRIILGLFGTYDRFGVSRFFARFIKDKSAFEKSLNVLFSHDFDNIIVGHGANVTGGGRELLLRGLAERGLKPRS